MKIASIQAFVFALLTASAAWAMDTPKPDPKEPEKKESKESQLDQARAAIARQDWAGAQSILRAEVARNPRSADAHNLYAYAIRKGPNPAMDVVFRHYNEALRIDPNHRGAHEYLGEAYLMTGNVAKAKEHLALLQNLCGAAGCPEYAALEKEISTFERQHAKK